MEQLTKSKRPRGTGSVYRHGQSWYVGFYHRGKEYKVNATKIGGAETEAQAGKFLKRQLADITTRKFIPNEERLTFVDLVTALENDYQANGRRSLKTAKNHVEHLKKFFGLDRAIDMTPDRVTAYQVHRLEEQASRATVNREVACLGRMFSLAVDAGKLSRKPKFKLLEGETVREDFIDHGTFLVLHGNLPDYLRGLVEFSYLSGWRRGSVSKLEWVDIDLKGCMATLRSINSKNKKPWILPLTGSLWEIIQARAKDRRLDCPYVFHRNGRKIGDFRKAWATACQKSGLTGGRAGVVPHDLRRCAARNLSRAGVPEQVAMQITGHKTTSMYRRYRIVDERDLREATERLQAHLQEQPKAPVVVPIFVVPKVAIR